MKYKSQQINIKPGLRKRVIIFENETPSYLWNFSKVNKYMRPRRGRDRLLSYEAKDYYACVVMFLNYLVENNYNPEEDLEKITLEIAQQFLTDYCTGYKSDGDKRSNAAMRYIRNDLIRFLSELQDRTNNPYLADVQFKEKQSSSYGKEKYLNVLSIIPNNNLSERPVFRECPIFFAEEVLKQARMHDINVWICIIFIYYVGIRPGSVCNLRHPDSIYGGSLEWEMTSDGKELIYLRINLNKEAYERPLRDDNTRMPGIKKAKIFYVDHVFKNIVFQAYQEYLTMTQDRKRQMFGPLIVNESKKKGEYNMAYTYDSLSKGLKKIVNKYVIPELISRGGEEEVFARTLEKTKWGPHMFREGFTTRYVAENRGNWSNLMFLRGDKDPSTAINYLLKGNVCNQITKDLSEENAKKILEKKIDDIPGLPYRL